MFPIGYLSGIIEAKNSFPAMYILLGIQQISLGIFLVSKEKKRLRIISLILGSLFLLIALNFALPTYKA